ncbi:MAG: type 1 glutamine amidotransferase [Gemmatimonadetes bacterium]|nr:type 1 glutamine amidotransferase [Gemmatimonadota bacterium]NNK64386.1 type 1 glutamine amidotransferase [Gemmatimonadota bacterium]
MKNRNSTPYDVKGKSVAILATHGFETSELTEPKKALDEAGVHTTVVSLPESDAKIRGFRNGGWDGEVTVDARLPDVSASDYDALLIPGGVMNPDRLRMFDDAVGFVRDFFEAGKPVSAICHGPWLLVEADVLKGRTVTSYPSIRTDLENAGATWTNDEVVTDQGLVTSRSPQDLPAFIDKMLEELAEGRHAGQTT